MIVLYWIGFTVFCACLYETGTVNHPGWAFFIGAFAGIFSGVFDE